MSSILPKNELENSNFCPSLLGQKFFVRFLEELKNPERHFEINRSLLLTLSLLSLSLYVWFFKVRSIFKVWFELHFRLLTSEWMSPGEKEVKGDQNWNCFYFCHFLSHVWTIFSYDMSTCYNFWSNFIISLKTVHSCLLIGVIKG